MLLLLLFLVILCVTFVAAVGSAGESNLILVSHNKKYNFLQKYFYSKYYLDVCYTRVHFFL